MAKRDILNVPKAFLIERLPRDILAEIFISCLPDFDGYGPEGSLSTRTAPFQLSHVSSSWRSLALSLPRLWTTVILEHPEHASIITCIHEWFGRSGTLPLAIRFNFTQTWDVSCQVVLDVLSQYISRWRFIEINVARTSGAAWQERGDAPLLRAFHIRRKDVMIPFRSAPLLTELRLPEFRSLRATSQSIPWHQLTDLTIDSSIAPDSALELMGSCPKLEALSISIWVSDDDWSHPHLKPRIELIHLRTLYLDASCDIRPILRCLILPALVEFSSGYLGYNVYGVVESLHNDLLDCFDQSECKLQQLKFTQYDLTPGEILDYLRHGSCTTLTDLIIENHHNLPILSDDLLTRLSIVDNGTGVLMLPNLTKLTLEMCFDQYMISPGRLGMMVLSRCHSGNTNTRSLKWFSAITPGPLPEDDEAFLKEAEALGVKMTLQVRKEDITDGYDSEEFYDTVPYNYIQQHGYLEEFGETDSEGEYYDEGEYVFVY